MELNGNVLDLQNGKRKGPPSFGLCFHMIAVIVSGAYCLQSCQYCKSCFYDEQTLDQHITTAHHFDKVRNHQTTTSSYLECNFCGKLFKNLNTLRNHKSLYHKGEK